MTIAISIALKIMYSFHDLDHNLRIIGFTLIIAGLTLNDDHDLDLWPFRMVGPLDATEVLTVNDFELLEKLTMSQYGEKLVQAFHNYLDVNREDISNIALVTGIKKLKKDITVPKSRKYIPTNDLICQELNNFESGNQYICMKK